jgi:hypothetical protein
MENGYVWDASGVLVGQETGVAHIYLYWWSCQSDSKHEGRATLFNPLSIGVSLRSEEFQSAHAFAQAAHRRSN